MQYVLVGLCIALTAETCWMTSMIIKFFLLKQALFLLTVDCFKNQHLYFSPDFVALKKYIFSMIVKFVCLHVAMFAR